MLQVDIFSLDLVLYPIHLGSHWCLAVVDNRHLTLSYYDSLGGRGLSCLAALRDYLVAEHRDKKKAELSLQGWTNIFAEVSWCTLSPLSRSLLLILSPSTFLYRASLGRRMALIVESSHVW